MGIQMIFSILFLSTIISAQVLYQPEQVHLAFGSTTDEIIVTWSTFNGTTKSVVEYGINGMVLRAEGSSRLFVDGGPQHRAQYIHQVTLYNLTPSSHYGL